MFRVPVTTVTVAVIAFLSPRDKPMVFQTARSAHEGPESSQYVRDIGALDRLYCH